MQYFLILHFFPLVHVTVGLNEAPTDKFSDTPRKIERSVYILDTKTMFLAS